METIEVKTVKSSHNGMMYAIQELLHQHSKMMSERRDILLDRQIAAKMLGQECPTLKEIAKACNKSYITTVIRYFWKKHKFYSKLIDGNNRTIIID